MSISTNSINCGDDFTSAENGEVNVDAICLENGQETELKMAKLELENVKKMAKLEIENKEQKLKLQEMMVEQKALKEKMAKIEQKKEKNAIAADQLTKILEKISEMEMQQKQQQNENTTKAAAEERFSQLQNEQNKELLDKINQMEKQQKEQTKATEDQFSKILKKISELEKQHENTNKATADLFSEMKMFSEFKKEQKQRKALLNFRQNYWDANVCDENLEIIGKKNLIVHYKKYYDGYCSSVFAKYPILLNNNSSDIFYYEISVKNNKIWMCFGFAVKQQNKLDGTLWSRKGTYAFYCNGWVRNNGEGKRINAEYSYDFGDTVGIGISSSTRQIIFTKNGKRLDFSDFFVAPSFADVSLHPFVSLLSVGGKIEANFGPNFKFDLTTL